MEFVHLHLHSEYSLLDGACRVRNIPEAVKAAGHRAAAITDHGVMYGCVEFWRAMKNAGLNAIIGCEVYVAPGSRFDRTPGRDGAAHHLVLLCENDVGYRNLIRLVSKSFTEGFYSKPRVDAELLREHHEGLIALSACLSGEIPAALTAGEREKAENAARKYAKIFGEDHFYIELQNHGIPEQRQILPELYDLARKLDLPVVATNDVHYLKKSDAEAQAVLMCIQTNSTMEERGGKGLPTEEFYYKSTEEMEKIFGGFEGAIENTVKIADRCHVNFEFGNYKLPAFPTPKGTSAGDMLRDLAYSGLDRLTVSGRLPAADYTVQEYLDRLNYELSVIHGMGYDDYFLIVSDYVGYAKKIGLPVGPGRGSGCGSLVAFCTGITDVDPIRFDLLFERFLNPERVSMPDIDIDFCDVRRGEMIRYVKEKYGDDHVSQIITFGTLGARAVLRDTGRVMGMSYADVDNVVKLIPKAPDVTIEKCLEVPALKELYESSLQIKDLVDTAAALEGMPRNVSIHAAGVVITGEPLSELVPLAVSKDAVITQYDMNTVADLGLLKFDFLALRYLTIIDDAVKQILESVPDFDIEKIDFSDKETYDLISGGHTVGVFQLEQPGMRAMLQNLKPSCIDDILAAIALYRPGPMESIPRYIEGKNAPEKVTYPHPMLEPVLSSTYGCIVYQEQVMSVFRTVAGYSFGHADIVRRAMSKKKASVLLAEREGFVTGAVERGMTKNAAEELFDSMESFASYAFNKSHAAAYAVLTFRTAYLKTHYPREYYSALLTSVLGSPEKVAEYISDASKAGIRVLPPDINRSMMDFHVSGRDITFGLAALKNIGRQFVDVIVRERARGDFTSFSDFTDRISGSTELNRRMLETLIKAGCFDSLGVYRSRLIVTLDDALETLSDRMRNNVAGQMDMFSMPGGNEDTSSHGISYPEIPEYPLKELLMLEKEVSGMYFSGHLLDGYSRHIASLDPVKMTWLPGDDDASDDENVKEDDSDSPAVELRDGQTVTLCGMITALTRKTTRAGEEMAFVTLEDRSGSAEIVVFPKKYNIFRDILVQDEAVTVTGNVSRRSGEKTKVLLSSALKLLTDQEFELRGHIAPPETKKNPPVETAVRRDVERNPVRENVSPFRTAPKVVYIRVPGRDTEIFRKCRNLCEIFEGGVRTVFFFADEKKYEDHPVGTEMTPFVANELKKIAGEDSVVVR